METIKINALAEQATEAAIAMGTSRRTAWEEHHRVYEPIEILHRTHGKEIFDPAIVEEFVTNAQTRLDRGEINLSHYSKIKRGSARLIEFSKTGKMEWTFQIKVSKFILNDYFENVIKDFIDTSNFHPNTCDDIIWVARKYFSWLICEGKTDLTTVGANEIQKFIMYCSNHLKLGSVHNTKLYRPHLFTVSYVKYSASLILKTLEINRHFC